MSSVSGTVMSKTLPNGYTVALDYNWDRVDGVDIMIMKMEAETYENMEELWSTTNVPGSWHNGHFDDNDVKAKFGAKFNQIFAREQKKLGVIATPRGKRVNGPGKGWHGDRPGHQRAARKRKGEGK